MQHIFIIDYCSLFFASLLGVPDDSPRRDEGQEEKGTTEDEMAGWHHWLYGRESEWTPGVGDGQGGLVCCDSWGCRVGHDWATELNWTELMTQTVNNLLAMRETRVRSLGQEDLLKNGMAIPVFLPGEFHRQRRLAGYSLYGITKSRTWLSV